MFMFLNNSSIWPIRPREIYNTTQLIRKIISLPELQRWWIVLLSLMSVLMLSCLVCCCWCVCCRRSSKKKLKPKNDDPHSTVKYSKLQMLGSPLKAKVQPDVIKLGKMTKRQFKIFT